MHNYNPAGRSEHSYVIEFRSTTNGTPVCCGITVDYEGYITSTQTSLVRFRGSTFSILKSWLYKIDPKYKYHEQMELF